MPILSRPTEGRLSRQIEARSVSRGNYAGEDSLLTETVSGQQVSVRTGTRPGFFQTCANPACESGWLHLWRGESTPIFEGGWNCSAACTAARVAAAVRRELDGRSSAEQNHRHRIPLDLLMLEQGWITSGQLRQALDAQKDT